MTELPQALPVLVLAKDSVMNFDTTYGAYYKVGYWEKWQVAGGRAERGVILEDWGLNPSLLNFLCCGFLTNNIKIKNIIRLILRILVYVKGWHLNIIDNKFFASS